MGNITGLGNDKQLQNTNNKYCVCLYVIASEKIAGLARVSRVCGNRDPRGPGCRRGTAPSCMLARAGARLWGLLKREHRSAPLPQTGTRPNPRNKSHPAQSGGPSGHGSRSGKTPPHPPVRPAHAAQSEVQEGPMSCPRSASSQQNPSTAHARRPRRATHDEAHPS